MLSFLAQRVFNTPLAIYPPKAEVIIAALAERFQLGRFDIDGRRVGAMAPAEFDDNEADDSGYDVLFGVARIPIMGTLVQRSDYVRPVSGLTGYNSIRSALLTALADDQVKAILFDIDSPGGEVGGLFDLAETVRMARGKKPIWAVLSENAFSAGYALACACDFITLPATGGVGSIGVIAMHVDFSAALKKDGISITLIQYGDRKADFNAYSPLSKEALARAQADVDTMGAMFDALVARNRKLSPEKVKSFQASTFMGAKGVAAGLADAVMAPDAAFRELIKSL